MRIGRLTIIVVLLLAASAVPAHALLVQGFVKNQAGPGVGQVAVTLTETGGIDQATVATNSFGYYFADVLAGTYDITFAPPPALGLLGAELTGVSLMVDTTLPDVFLAPGIIVSGTVLDTLGQPVIDVDLNFVDQADGQVVSTPGDKTDALGHFTVVVPAGTYNVSFRPAVDVPLAPQRLTNVTLAVDTVLPTVVLQPGLQVSGTVVDSLGMPVPNMDLDFFDASTGAFVYTIRDHTDGSGAYSTFVGQGSYNIHFIPPPDSNFVAQKLINVSVTADITLPDVILETGAVITGFVVDTLGVGIAGVDLNLFNASTGLGVFVAYDTTAADGSYRIVVSPDIYNVQYAPVAGSRYVAARTPGLPLLVDQQLPDVVLQEGLFVSGAVYDEFDVPIAGVDLDFFDSATGLKVFTANDDTNANGIYSVPVPQGEYTIHLVPPRQSNYLPQKLFNVLVLGDVVLPDSILQTGFAISGIVQEPAGQPIRDVDVDVVDAVTGSGVFIVHDNTDVAGQFRVVVSAGNYFVRLYPPVEDRLLPSSTPETVLAADLDLGVLVLQPGVWVEGYVFDDGGVPASDIDIDLIDETSGTGLLLRGDLTDATGFFRTVAPPGSYTVHYEPPPSTGLLPLVVNGAAVLADTVLPSVFLQAGFIVEGLVIDSGGQPIPGVDIDIIDSATGVGQFLVGDLTDETGFFRTVVAAGLYRVQYEPPLPFLPTEVGSVSVVADTTLPAQTLQTGVIVSGLIVDPDGGPVASVDTDWFVDGTCTQLFTKHDSTDVSGHFALALPAGVYRVILGPPPGSGVFRVILEGQAVGPADTTLLTQHLPFRPMLGDTCDGLDNDCDGAVDEGCGIQLLRDKVTMAWSSVPLATGYDVVVGDLQLLRQTGDFGGATTACLADDQAATAFAESDPIGPGELFWYLVRSVFADSVGSYGSPLQDTGVDSAPAACP